MLAKLVKTVVEMALGRLILGVGGIVLVLGVGFSLVYGRDALMMIGLSRTAAGSIATIAVVAACVYGMYLFATKAIDW